MATLVKSSQQPACGSLGTNKWSLNTLKYLEYSTSAFFCPMVQDYTHDLSRVTMSPSAIFISPVSSWQFLKLNFFDLIQPESSCPDVVSLWMWFYWQVNCWRSELQSKLFGIAHYCCQNSQFMVQTILRIINKVLSSQGCQNYCWMVWGQSEQKKKFKKFLRF